MIVNLYSDTQTRPSKDMRAAMAGAEVGDEQSGEDPTTRELEQRVAALLGKEAAVFMPSGTMCNEVAIRIHVRPGGEEMFLGKRTHPLEDEAGGPAVLSGAVLTVLDGERGTFTGESLDAAVRAHPPENRYAPRPRLVCVEQTANLAGGTVWPVERVRGVLEVAAEHDLRAHLDGARLLNAVVASGVAASEWAEGFDSAWIDFSKGLGAPIGACLAGSEEFIAEAWRWKQMLGGAMRQSGIVAAGALYALEHNVERLAEDHARARRLAEGLAGVPGIELDPQLVETNIVVFGVADADGFCERLETAGVRMGALDERTVRAVTHLDVDDAGIERAVEVAGDLRSLELER
jgi:threonine aldolase